MTDQNMPTTYETQTTTRSSRTIGFHPEYLRTIPGILKICEIVLSLITFICAIVWGAWSGYGGGWVQFVAISAFVTTLVHLILYLLGMRDRLPPIFFLIEFIYYCIFTVFFLIAAIVAASRAGWHASIGAAAFFAFAATAVYAVDTFFQFRAWRTGQTEMAANTTTTTTTQNAEAGKAVY